MAEGVTIEEANRLRDECERKILQAISDFQHSSGLGVDNVNLITESSISERRMMVRAVRLDVSL